MLRILINTIIFSIIFIGTVFAGDVTSNISNTQHSSSTNNLTTTVSKIDSIKKLAQDEYEIKVLQSYITQQTQEEIQLKQRIAELTVGPSPLK